MAYGVVLSAYFVWHWHAPLNPPSSTSVVHKTCLPLSHRRAGCGGRGGGWYLKKHALMFPILPRNITPQTLRSLIKNRTESAAHLGIGVRHLNSWRWDLGLRVARAEAGAECANLVFELTGRRAEGTNPSHLISSPTASTTTTCTRMFHRPLMHIATAEAVEKTASTKEKERGCRGS